MDPFVLHTTETTDNPVSELLTGVFEQLGFLPNVFAVMGGAPSALAGFVALNQQFAGGSLSALEREIVQTATSVENQAGYCVAGHSAFVEMQSLDRGAIQAVRGGDPLADPKAEALRIFTRRMVEHKGQLSPAALAEFLEAGYGADQVFEVILGIALKFLTNLTSNISQLPLDGPFAPHAWTPSVARKDAA